MEINNSNLSIKKDCAFVDSFAKNPNAKERKLRLNANNVQLKQQLKSDTFGRSISFGSRAATGVTEKQNESIKSEIPEYLYHFTNRKNYDSMLKTGKINISHNRDLIDGIYTVDLENFFKYWNNSPVENGGNLKASLLEKACGTGESDIVVLRIPTKSIKANNIVIRTQDEVIQFAQSKKCANLEMVYAEKGGMRAYKSELPKNLTEGYPAKNAQKFNDEGRALEYIIKNDIDISNVELVGQMSHEMGKMTSCDTTKMNKILSSFFKGTPEENLTNLYA